MSCEALHSLLLLSDSALPLGSFAFSSGLESFLAHKHLPTQSSSTKVLATERFLRESIHNIASTSLPYVRDAYQHPHMLENLDNDFDASTPCTVARRASIAQGRALLQIWERAFSTTFTEQTAAVREVSEVASRLKANIPDSYGLHLQAHFAPLFGAVCAALKLSEYETEYIFLLNHAKAVLSAAVRAGILGPYQSQAILASDLLQAYIDRRVKTETSQNVQDAAVTIPTMDLWMGRHELLYSRIFNS